MKVLLLGATGLLGHNVLRRLTDDGHRVVALVRHADAVKLPQGGWETVTGSPLDYDTLSRVAEGCDAVVNCAGTTDMSLRRYEDYLPVNRDLCGLLVRLLDEHGISTLVHTSTVNTIGFGTAEKAATEEVPMAPPFQGSYYADSKREGERIILAAATEGRHVVVVNPGYMLGPWDVKPSSGQMLLMARGRRLMLAPKGGKAFVHVDDVAQAIVAALDHGQNGQRYIALNSQGMLSVKQLYEMQAEVVGERQRVWEVPNGLLLAAGRVGDVLRGCGVKTQLSSRNVRQLMVREYYDNSRAVNELGMPETPIVQAIADFYEWRNTKK
jgi:nucleoside-diphosphate-sugar epimerase